MKEIVECAMNVSEGRDETKLEAIAGRIEDTPDAFLLGYSADPAHHRTVFTFIGNQDSILEAAFRAGEKAVQLIDLRVHKGVHPRIGAVDVIPFVPIQGVNMHDCVQIAHRLARSIAGDLHVPVYLYAEAAIRTGREFSLRVIDGLVELFLGAASQDFVVTIIHGNGRLDSG